MKKMIYEFEVPQEIEVEKTDTKEENGQKISVTTKVKENRPVKFGLKRPSMSEKEDAEMARSAYFGKCVKAGVITQAELRKKYGDSGGIYTLEEEKQYVILRNKLRDSIEAYQLASVESQNTPKEELDRLFNEIFSLRGLVMDFENSANFFYQDTAEYKSRNHLIECLSLQLTYFKRESDKDWVSFFGGDNLEEKRISLEKYEEENNELYLASRDKIILFFSLFLQNQNLTKEEMDSLQVGAT